MSEFVRHTLDRVRSAWEATRDRFTGASAGVDRSDYRYLPWVAAVIFVLVVVYYPVGMLLNNRVEDDLNLQAAPQFDVPGGSRAVAVATTLVARDADHWLPNAPFWH